MSYNRSLKLIKNTVISSAERPRVDRKSKVGYRGKRPLSIYRWHAFQSEEPFCSIRRRSSCNTGALAAQEKRVGEGLRILTVGTLVGLFKFLVYVAPLVIWIYAVRLLREQKKTNRLLEQIARQLPPSPSDTPEK